VLFQIEIKTIQLPQEALFLDAKMEDSMSDIESDYSDYDMAKGNEGGPHGGRSEPSRGLVMPLSIVLGLLILSAIALTLIARS
jgi:hypothetical protein